MSVRASADDLLLYTIYIGLIHRKNREFIFPPKNSSECSTYNSCTGLYGKYTSLTTFSKLCFFLITLRSVFGVSVSHRQDIHNESFPLQCHTPIYTNHY